MSFHANAQSAEWIAHKTGNPPLAFTKKALASGMVYDANDNTLTFPRDVARAIPKVRPNLQYIYTYPGPNDYYRFIDQNGEVHVLKSYGGRYDPGTKRYQTLLVSYGQWQVD
jgi:hypothetical protein